LKSFKSQTTEDKLRAYLHLFDILVNAISDPIFLKDHDNVYQGCNKSFAKLVVGKERIKIIGKKDKDINIERLKSFFEQNKKNGIKLLNTKANIEFEMAIICSDGLDREYFISLNPITDKNKVIGIVGVMHDLTTNNEQKRLEAALASAATFCHEMNQPLQTISILSDHIRKDINSANKIFVHMNKIDEQISRMIEISKKIQSMAKYKTKNYPGNKKILDVTQ
jgi:PAS domain S-box-containing protein